MKIQIDTDNKTITLNEDILLKFLLIELDKLFPNKSWEHFTLIKTPIVNWNNPIIIEPIYPSFSICPTYPQYSTYPWIVICEMTTRVTGSIDEDGTIKYGSGTYNVEIK